MAILLCVNKTTAVATAGTEVRLAADRRQSRLSATFAGGICPQLPGHASTGPPGEASTTLGTADCNTRGKLVYTLLVEIHIMRHLLVRLPCPCLAGLLLSGYFCCDGLPMCSAEVYDSGMALRY